jgi:hypothetical protein
MSHLLSPRALVRALVPFTLFLALLFAAQARAGTYAVHACDASNVNRSWTPYGDTGLIAADASCLADPTRGMKVRNSLRGAGQVPVLAPSGATGGLQALAPAGTSLTGLHADATAYDERGSSGIDGWRAGIRVNGRDDVWCAFQQGCSWIGPPTLRIDLPLAAASVQLTAICGLSTGCQRDRVRAATTLRNISLDVRDDVAPALVVRRGDLWGTGTWLHGTAFLEIGGSDNAGVRLLTIEAGGITVGSDAQSCDYTAMTPCPGAATLQASIDTTRLPDGPSPVIARVTDTAGNVTEQRSTIEVDNTPPTIATPTIRGGSGWRSANGFEIGFDARDDARASGVRSVVWTVCRLDGTDCYDDGGWGNLTSARVTLPAAGEWKVRAYATDAVSTGPLSGWSEPLRFDAAAPGPATVDAGGAWKNGDAASNVVVSFADGSAHGPSGIAGYAVSHADAAPGTALTERGDRVLVALGSLPEGTTRVRARAISGAGVASAQVGEGLVRIDRTPPVVELSTDGAPLVAREGEWLREGVRLTARAVDQDGLSGMAPAPAGEPITRGGHLEYQVDDEPLVRVRGAGETIDLPQDGLHIVTVRAVDVAGNVSAPQRASFRVDRTRPTGLIDAIDPLAPRRLHAAIAEECLDSATLELLARGSRDWTSIPVQLEKRAVTALVPDDRLPAGDYAARFRVRDCAGNEGFVAYSGATGTGALRLPLRETIVVDGGLAAGAAHGVDHVTVVSGTAVLVRGRVTTLDGRLVSGRRVEVQERIGDGDWRVRAVRVSDDVGRVAAELPTGPSRRIRLVVADNEQEIGGASRILAIAVPARVTLSVNRTSLRNGEAARFSGKLLGGFVPRRGRELELQGFNPLKGRWQPVRTQGLRTTRTGRWHTTYRFTSTIGATVTYRFRVRVAPRPDHPFAEGFSRAVTVTVRG